MPQLRTKSLEFGVSPTLLGNQKVVARRAQGEKIYHMGFGESPFPVPKRIQKSLAEHSHHKKYFHTAGLPALRDAIAAYYGHHYGINPGDYDVIVTPGSKLLLFAMQLAYEGDLMMPVPSWVSYAPQARLLGHNVIKLPTQLDDSGYHIDPEILKQTITQARKNGLNPSKIILNTPNNPAGLCIPQQEMDAIAKTCAAEDVVIIDDQIYGLVQFEHKLSCAARVAPAHTIISSGLSKHLSLGGWRVGYGLIPKALDGLFESLCQIASETWSAVAGPVQYAAIDAFMDYPDIEDFITDCTTIHAHMNTYIASHLRALGITCTLPQGAFYCYPDFAPFKGKLAAKGILTSEDLFAHLLDHYKIATLPGTAFGAEPDVLTLRLSGCDYDGTTVLEAYRAGGNIDDAFINKYAPNIAQGCDAYTKFIKSL